MSAPRSGPPRLALHICAAALVVIVLAACKSGNGGGDSGSSAGSSGSGNDSGFGGGSSSYVLYGLNFSPYVGRQDPNAGATVDSVQIRERLQLLVPGGQRDSDWIRTFGVSGGLELVPRIAHELGFKTAVGAWLGPDLDANAREISTLIRLINADFVDLAIVGSETLVRGDLTSSQLVNYIDRVRRATERKGIPVTTADRYGQLLDNPDVIAASSVVMPNYYPYWEGVDIADAIPILHSWHLRMLAAAGNKAIIVSESGWPSDGDSLGDADPSPENAAKYFLDFVSWARAEKVNYFYFEALDQPWKAAYEGAVGAHWGIRDQAGVLKEGMNAVFNNNTVDDYWTPRIIDGPGDPEITLTFVPPRGSFANLRGAVSHVNPLAYNVAVYIRVGSGWWTKPTLENPLTPIVSNGNWSTDITTGGDDQLATEIAAYLIPAEYSPPPMSGETRLPAELDANAVASVTAKR